MMLSSVNMLGFSVRLRSLHRGSLQPTASLQSLLVYLVVTSAQSHGEVQHAAISAEGKTTDSGLLSWLRRDADEPQTAQAHDQQIGHPSLMRRDSDWLLPGDAKSIVVNAHNFVSVSAAQHVQSGNGAIGKGAQPVTETSWDDRLQSVVHNVVEVHNNASGNASKEGVLPDSSSGDGKSTLRVQNQTYTETVPSTLFRLAEPVVNFTHGLTAINEMQWPASFCVNMDLLAPAVDRAVPERCIVLLGGDESSDCGLFNIYINDYNQVGMGVTCHGDDETYDTTGDSPLLTHYENNSIVAGQIYNLSFCYDSAHGDASIWENGKLYIRGTKVWDFPRKGLVSVFVGSHTINVGGAAVQALNWEDGAKLYQLDVSNNFHATTTEVLTTTGWYNPLLHTSTLSLIEVNMSIPNPIEETEDSKALKAGIAGISTPLQQREGYQDSDLGTHHTDKHENSSAPHGYGGAKHVFTTPRTTTTSFTGPRLHHARGNEVVYNNTKSVETIDSQTVVTDIYDGSTNRSKLKLVLPPIDGQIPPNSSGAIPRVIHVRKTITTVTDLGAGVPSR